jgi:hypothetical protein
MAWWFLGDIAPLPQAGQRKPISQILGRSVAVDSDNRIQGAQNGFRSHCTFSLSRL